MLPIPDDEDNNTALTMIKCISAIVFLLFAVIALFMMLNSCTLSLQTINTSGTASDLVEEEQTTETEADPSIPLSVV